MTRPSEPRPAAHHDARRRFAAASLAALVLLQALWVPFHLATERHVAIADAVLASVLVANVAGSTSGMDGVGGRAVVDDGDAEGDTHLAIDHQLVKSRCGAFDDDGHDGAPDGASDGGAAVPPPPMPFVAACCGELVRSTVTTTGPPRGDCPRLRPDPRAPPRA